jgi:hypothetical protein
VSKATLVVVLVGMPCQVHVKRCALCVWLSLHLSYLDILRYSGIPSVKSDAVVLDLEPNIRENLLAFPLLPFLECISSK